MNAGQFHGDRMYGADGQYLVPNQVVCSSEGRFMLKYQSDGNLVIYDVRNNNTKSLSNQPNPPAPFPEREGGDIISTPLSVSGRGRGEGYFIIL